MNTTSSVNSDPFGKSLVSFDPNLERSGDSDGSIGRSIAALTESMATTNESEDVDQAAAVVGQLQNLIKQQFQAKENSYKGIIKNVTQQNETLLSKVDDLTRDYVQQLLKTMVLEVALAAEEKESARVKLENTKLEVEIEEIEEALEDSEETNARVEMENSLLVGYVRNDLLKLSVASKALELLKQLSPSNQVDLSSVQLQLQEVGALLTSLQTFDEADPARVRIMKVFNYLASRIEALKQEALEASKPLDQPKLKRLLDKLRQHLIRYQIKQIRELLKKCSREQIQPISQDLEKDIKKLYQQVHSFIPKEDPEPDPGVTSGSSWWTGWV